MTWKSRLDEKHATRFDGPNYCVFLFFPHGVRYVRDEGTLTLSSEPLFMNDENGGKERWLRGIYVPKKQTWDSGAPIAATEFQFIRADIETALRAKSEHYRFVIDDSVYEAPPLDSIE